MRSDVELIFYEDGIKTNLVRVIEELTKILSKFAGNQ